MLILTFSAFIAICNVNVYLQIQMNDGLAVHIINTLADLADKENAVALSQRKIVSYNTFEKLSTCDAVIGYESNVSMVCCNKTKPPTFEYF